MPGRPYIYVDVLFVVNFLMDYVILWATARLAQIRCVPWRLVCGALLGALYSVTVLLPGLEFLSVLWMKFLVSILMVVTAFTPLMIRKLGQVVLYFYLIAFTLGGTVLGINYLLSSVTIHSTLESISLPYLWLAVALGAAVLFGKWGVPFLKKTFFQDLLRVPVVIKIQGRQLKVNGLVDTGNQLVDPLTGAPVIIVEQDVLLPFLPDEARDLWSSGGELNFDKLSSLPEKGRTPSWRLIPFTTIGKHHGMLVGFKPDEITILAGDQQVRNTNVIIGIYSRRLSPRGTYRALLHPDLLHAPAGT